MTTVLPFSNNAITVYKYEPFSYTISSYPYPITKVTVSPGIPSATVTSDVSTVVFASSGLNVAVSKTETIVIDVSGASSSSNSVVIATGRFRDVSGNSIGSLSFFKNEPIAPVQFVSSISLAAPLQSYPALPPGLGFTQTASNIFTLQGTPTLETPTSNYQILGMGKNGDIGKVVQSFVPITVGAERIQLNLTGSPIVSNMAIDTPISQRVVTARYPLSSSGNLRYTWDPLPAGIFFGDSNGTSQASGFQPLDASSTLTLQGTPTLGAAKSFAAAGITNYTAGVRATRLTPVPVISNTTAFTFQFEPSVLFDDVSIPAYYAGIALDPSATFFSARTYFNSDASISTIFALSLPTGLSLNFVSNQSRAYLTGTPTTVGTGTYTIRASNTLGVTRDLLVSIPISNDTVSFDYSVTPAIDTCYNFILSRPLISDLSGYYSNPIRFRASAVSGRSVAYTSPDLVGTGITLDISSGNAILSGIPDTVTALKTVSVVASAVGSPATASTPIKLAVLNEQFTFGSVPATSRVFIQNRAITPIQLSATTLSGRPIISFTASGLPAGLTCSSTGLISGTPTTFESPTATITASTGFTTGSTTLTFQVLRDNIVIAIPNETETVPTVFSNTEFSVLTYSGTTGVLTPTPTSNRAPQQATDVSLSFSNNTFLSGDYSKLPALLPNYKFAITGSANALSTSVTVNVGVTNPSSFTRHLAGLDSLDTTGIPSLGVIRVLRNTQVPLSLSDPNNPASFAYAANALTWSDAYTASNVQFGFHDFAQNSSAIIGVVGSNIVRSLDKGVTWTIVPSSNIQTISNVSGGPVVPRPPNPVPYVPGTPLFSAIATDGVSNWVAFGHGSINNTNIHVIRTSSNNGVTWTDASLSFLFASTPQTRLFYSGGRYFLLTGIPGNVSPPPSNVAYRADASNLTSWTNLNGPFGFTNGDALNGFASDGSGTLLVVGSNGSGPGTSACYKSTDNGTSWAQLPSSPIAYSNGAQINAAYYGNGGIWAVVGSDAAAQSAVSFSSNLTSWDQRSALGTGALQVAADDGATWQFGGLGATSWVSGYWSNAAIVTQTGTSAGLNSNTKRFLSLTSSTGTPTLTLSLPYDSNAITFVSPASNVYSLWQYVPIDPIRIQAQTSLPGEFLYYYATGLPPGLSFLTDDLSGSFADISGTSVRYSDAYQRVRVTVANGNTTAVRTLNLGLRTILPTIQKQQTSAGAWTSLLRQYTQVNAAQNARDNRVFPQVDRILGEFTAPYPPNVVTQTIDPKCRNECP